MISATHLADVFVEVADTLIDDFDLVTFLDMLTDNAAKISGADAVGLVLSDARGVLQLMAASNQAGRALELFQLQHEEGPCRDAFLSRQPVVNIDLDTASDTWPRFAPRAREAGFTSVHAFPLRLREHAIGALNLFGRASTTFADTEVRVVQAVADIATIAILQERGLAEAEQVSTQLQVALNSRVLVEQAKGAVSRIEGVSIDEAFTLLRERARSDHRRLIDVADDVLRGS